MKPPENCPFVKPQQWMTYKLVSIIQVPSKALNARKA